jgi:hypothetical protein
MRGCLKLQVVCCLLLLLPTRKLTVNYFKLKNFLFTFPIKMPLPTDEVLVAKANEVKDMLKGAFGTPPGFRPGTSPILTSYPNSLLITSFSPCQRHSPNRKMDTLPYRLHPLQSLALQKPNNSNSPLLKQHRHPRHPRERSKLRPQRLCRPLQLPRCQRAPQTY